MSDELRDKILIETVGKFNIFFTPLIDHENPVDYIEFETKAQKRKYLSDIRRGNFLIFIAKVSVSVKGVQLGTSYQGRCGYFKYEDFYIKYKDEDYSDMKTKALEEAKKTLKSLVAA